jgi:P-type Ca2+ transporter type 2C
LVNEGRKELVSRNRKDEGKYITILPDSEDKSNYTYTPTKEYEFQPAVITVPSV